MNSDNTSTNKRNNPCKIHLKVAIEDYEYVMGTLSLNLSKNEMSYHFHHPPEGNKNPLNLGLNQITSRLDHITWHKKEIHIKRKDEICVGKIPSPGDSFFTTVKTNKGNSCRAFFFKWHVATQNFNFKL